MKKNVLKKILCILLALLMVALLFACGNADSGSSASDEALTYKLTVSGKAESSGTVSFLDYDINVYKDEASNPCGDCEDQPVHLYVGDDAETIAQAISDAVTRSEDLWTVESLDGTTVTLKEKTQGSVDEIKHAGAPSGVTIEEEITGRDVTIVDADEADSDNKVSGSNSSNSGESETAADGISDDGIAYPENPERLAAVYGPSYELLTMLGAEDKIVVRADVQTDDFPWAEKIFSKITETPQLDNVHNSVDFEELMKYDPDVVYTFPRESELNQLMEAGIPALAGETTDTLDDVKNQVRKYAETLGEDAVERAEEYCQYFDAKLAMVKEKTSKIDDADKPKVYYCGVDILTTYGKYSDIPEVIEAAGGIAVSKDLEAGNRSQINYEQLMAWNPDVIFIDHGGMNDGETVEELKEDIMSQDVYKSLNAVKNDQIYLSPSGVFYWDMGIQKILLVMNMAKILHPDEFKDLDMEKEVMTFYKKFYNYDLTKDEASRILNRLSPEE